MRRRSTQTLVCSVAATIAALGVLPALAHPGVSEIRGIVIVLTNSSMQVETTSGVVTVAVSANTQVVRIASGSQMDLAPNEHVEAHVVPGTSRLDSVLVDMPPLPHPDQPGGPHRPPHHPPGAQRPSHQSHPHHTPPSPDGHVDGQIVSVGAHSLTLRTYSGSTTYTLAAGVTINRLVRGGLQDLSVGESVQVTSGRDHHTALITIVHA